MRLPMQAGLHGEVCEKHTHVKPMTSKGAINEVVMGGKKYQLVIANSVAEQADAYPDLW